MLLIPEFDHSHVWVQHGGHVQYLQYMTVSPPSITLVPPHTSISTERDTITSTCLRTVYAACREAF